MAKQTRIEKKALSTSTATPSSAEFLQSRPFTEVNNSTQASPNIQKRSQQAKGFGHSFGDIAVQPKLTIGQPGDKYEQEADQVAAQVVQRINEPSTQRQELGEEDELQMKPEAEIIQRDGSDEVLGKKII